MVDDPLKIELTTQLARSRSLLSMNLGQLKADLDVSAHVKRNFMNHRTSWIGGAALLGWAISRLRKSHGSDLPHEKLGPKILSKQKAPLLPGVAKILLQAARPALTAFVSHKIAGIASNRH